MRKTRPVVVALAGDKNLGLIFETAKGPAMNDTVTVALKGGARAGFRLGRKTASGLVGVAGDRRQDPRQVAHLGHAMVLAGAPYAALAPRKIRKSALGACFSG